MKSLAVFTLLLISIHICTSCATGLKSESEPIISQAEPVANHLLAAKTADFELFKI